MSLELMYITNSPEVALIAEKHGVGRIWIDLESLGKEERQKNMNCVMSSHTVHDIEIISGLLTKAECMVRINPWNENSANEIEEVISAGADRIMLPMWKTAAEAVSFLEKVNGRVATTLLLETKEAEMCLDEVLKHPLIDEVHIGLNDLHLSYGLTFMFELLSNGTVEKICKKLSKAGVKYGFGGIARMGKGLLPAQNIIMEHFRIGSTRAILSRSFCNTEEITDIEEVDRIFKKNIKEIRDYEETIASKSEAEFIENVNVIKEKVDHIVDYLHQIKNLTK